MFKYLVILSIILILVSGCVQKTVVYESTVNENIIVEKTSLPEEDLNQTNLTAKNPRWGKLFLNVFIDEDKSALVDGFNKKLVDIFKTAAITLSESVNNKLTFKFVTDRSKADIEVIWVGRLPTNSLDAIGHTELKYSIGSSFSVIKAAAIQLLTSKDGRPVTDHQALLLSLHEIGHAIGLDHSKSKQSIMYPELQDDVKGLSEKDIENILGLYKQDSLPELQIFNITGLKRIVDSGFVKHHLSDVSFSVVNDGLIDSGEFLFSIDVGDNRVENNSTSLSPGQIFRIKYTNLSSSVDFSKISIRVDPENQIKELDETNNLKTIFIEGGSS